MPRVVDPVCVVVVCNLFRVRESRETVAAGGARRVERLVLDQLARVGLLFARRRTIDQAVCVILFLEVQNIVVPNPNLRRVQGPECTAWAVSSVASPRTAKSPGQSTGPSYSSDSKSSLAYMTSSCVEFVELMLKNLQPHNGRVSKRG